MEYSSDGDTLHAEVYEAGRSVLSPSGASTSETLILLHPTPLDHRFWTALLPSLDGYHCLVPDLRGHGRSLLGRAPCKAEGADDGPVLTIQQLARDVVALLDATGVEKAVFVGCSIGGYTLFELWRTVPSRVVALIFCASKPQADTEAERSKRQEWIAKHESARLAGSLCPTNEFVDAMLAALLSKETLREQPVIVAQARAMMEQVRPGALQAIQRGLGARPDSCATARGVSVPTCVLAGQQDSSSRPEDMEALHDLLRAGGSPSEYHLVKEASHYFPMERPGAVGLIFEAFLAACTRTG